MPGQDQFVWIQNGEPISLYCNDETDGETFRACYHIFDTLYWYKPGTTELVALLQPKATRSMKT